MTVELENMNRDAEFRCNGPNCTSRTPCAAHIIPAGFGRRVAQEDGFSIIVTPEYAGRARFTNGEFDKTILCADCDGRLGYFDDYALEVVEKFDAQHKKLHRDVFELPGFDGERLARFV